MAQTSGFEALLDALKQSGMNVDGMGGKSASSAAEDTDGGGSKGSGASERGRAGGANPFGSFPFGGANPFTGGGDPPHVDMQNPFANMGSWGKRSLVLLGILLAVVLAVAYWWFHPPISINSPDLWMFLAVFVLLPLFAFSRVRARTYETGTSKVDPDKGKFKAFKTLSYVPVAVALVGVAGFVLSLSLFPGNAERYANVLQTDTHEFASDIAEVDYAQIPVIDRDSAELLGNREMGSIAEYVSQFEISNLYSQINYQGGPVRVSPLGYADLFKWLTNRVEGIPAYALVNMTTQDAEIVRLGDKAIFYSQSEPLVRNIDRHVQLSYPFYIFDEKSFEIDEDGQPWWICPVRTYTIGLFGGETINRVVLCNATTGECQDMAVEDVPQWVDRVYPADLLIRQYNWSGAYQSGWFNSWLGQSGVVQTTPGVDGNRGYNYIAKDDDVWVYTGVTSATSDSSIVGFVLVNQRTAESHYYSVSGATEASAMESAEGQVQNLRYTATFPLLINVADQPTYFMALKDQAGLVKQFAMIDIQRYQNVAVGTTVAECQKSYEALLATNGALVGGSSDDVSGVSMKIGVIRTMAQAVVDGTSHFYVTLEGDEGIYDFALPGLIGIVGYQPGDTISFEFRANTPTSLVSSIVDSSDVAAGAAQGATGAAGAGDVDAAGAAGAADGATGSGTGSSSIGIPAQPGMASQEKAAA